jgi:HAD superfamily hydrolase (TIGR01509 family)
LSVRSSHALAAVVFDLDGVLVDTEPIWAAARRELTIASGGRWTADAATAMLGMSGPEWAAYLHDELGVPLSPAEIRRTVVEAVLRRVAAGVPVIDGAPAAVRTLAERWPLALASSADRTVIDAVLRAIGLADRFRATVSSEEAGRGKPAPDVYLAAAEALDVEPSAAVAVEDSPNGMRAAKAAGMALIAIPKPGTDAEQMAREPADVVLRTIAELTPAAVEQAATLNAR